MTSPAALEAARVRLGWPVWVLARKAGHTTLQVRRLLAGQSVADGVAADVARVLGGGVT